MKQSNIKIAVTGGIGSGKSTVCKIINKNYGYPVFSCDEVYADLLKGEKLINLLTAEFGNGIINADNSLNRGALSNIVFSDAGKLKKLNEITHGEIFKEMFSRAERCSGIVFFEVPLLFEGNYQNLFDGVIVVLRDEEQRIKSVAARDGVLESEVKNRINKQFNYDFNKIAEYYVIHNCGKIEDLNTQIDTIMPKLTK